MTFEPIPSPAHPVAPPATALLLGLALALLLGACASSEPARLHLGMEDAPEGKRILWPSPPDIPRYLYAGQLVGEQNFVRDDAAAGAVDGFFRWLAGLVAGEAAPQVLQRPQSGVVDEALGRIYVTDVSRGAVYVFDEKQGKMQIWDKAIGFDNFVTPLGIGLGPAGEVMVADADLAAVVRLDAAGNPAGLVGRGVLKRPTGLAYDAARQILYVSDTHDHDIKVFDAEWRFVRTIGHRGTEAGEFNFPTYLTLSNDRLYVTDTMNNRVQILDTEGHPLSAFGERGLYIGNMVRPKGVAVDTDGNVYVVESYYDYLLIFNRKGEFLMPIGGLGKETGSFYLPSGAWTDSRNRVFVADTFNGRVVVFQFLGGDSESQ